MRPKRMWVSPKFHKKVSMKAAESGMSKIEVTDKLSNNEFDIDMRERKGSLLNYEVHILPPKRKKR